jgi:hypothetical protein
MTETPLLAPFRAANRCRGSDDASRLAAAKDPAAWPGTSPSHRRQPNPSPPGHPLARHSSHAGAVPVGTLRRPQSPKGSRNPAKPRASQSAPAIDVSPICRCFTAETRSPRLPENRGVPGSSPGLATAKAPTRSGFSYFRSDLRAPPRVLDRALGAHSTSRLGSAAQCSSGC